MPHVFERLEANSKKLPCLQVRIKAGHHIYIYIYISVYWNISL